jgi:hypothetical protein
LKSAVKEEKMKKYLFCAIFGFSGLLFAEPSIAQPYIVINAAEKPYQMAAEGQGFWGKTKTVTSDVWDGTKEVTSDVWDGTKKVTSDVWDGTKEVAQDVEEGVSGDDGHTVEEPKESSDNAKQN